MKKTEPKAKSEPKTMSEEARKVKRAINDMPKRLKSAREALFSEATAFAAAHGFVPQTYNSHESGGRRAKIDDLLRYADALGVSFEWLFLGKPEATASSAAADRYKKGTVPEEVGDLLNHYNAVSDEAKERFLSLFRHSVDAERIRDQYTKKISES